MTTEPDSITRGAEARLGTVLRGKYRLDRVIGVGGMAVVYKATHRNQADFAVKMLHPELNVREDVRTRFLREGYAANSVKHPGAVRVVDDDVAEDGVAFLVMDLLDGASVESLWERSGRRLPPRAVLSVADQLLDVLAAAHEKGIVHRDIKPENLFVTRDGSLRVLDFGIARLKEATSSPESNSGKGTGTGMVLGTPAFMAPEQAYAKASEIDGQTDVWAVGATLFTLLTGQAVHVGENATQLLVNAATARARSVSSLASNVPPSLAETINRALAFEKGARWASAAAMRQAVLAVSTEMFGDAPSTSVLVELVTQEPVASSALQPRPRAVIRSGPGAPATGAAVTVASEGDIPLPSGGSSRGLLAGVAIALVLAAGLAVAWFTLRPPHAADGAATPVDPSRTPPLPTGSSGSATTEALPVGAEKAHRCAASDLADCTAQCAKKDLASCASLASIYRTGRGGAKDEPKALALYRQGCDAGHQASCNGLGLMYENGLGGAERDAGRAVKLFADACAASDPAGCGNLGRMYLRGLGVTRDEGRAFALYKQACDGGFAAGCAHLGHEYARGKVVPKDDVKAVALYKQACDNPMGSLGCSFLGLMYAKGRAVPKDLPRAVALYKEGCEAGNPLGCSSLGELYAEGKAVPKDEARATELFKEACDGNGPAGCTRLGELYADGKGVARDEAQAIAFFKQGCQADGEPGCFAMGLAYERGLGVPVDRAKALDLYRRGCKAENAWDCAQLRRLKGQ